MQITNSHRKQFTICFIVIFYTLAIYKVLNGLWLFQVAPYFFVNRFDGVTWIFMQTGIHQWLIDNPSGWIFSDFLFYGMPLVWYFTDRYYQKAGFYVAICWLFINCIYVQSYTLFPTNSIEGHLAWLLMPILFSTRRLNSFYYIMHGLRYFFLFFFVSAAIWKIRQGGIFYPQQMSGILLMQHGNYLISAPESWFSRFTYWLIRHSMAGYSLYIGATLLELTFMVGFFTKRYDRFLFSIFVLFLSMDLFIMRIPYFEIFPLALPLFFSKYAGPKNINA